MPDGLINASDDRQRALRDVFGTFATGVTIVTARGTNGQALGVTVNSFTSVSLDPPLILWSLAERAASLPAFLAAQRYAIHVLSADQAALAQRFARSGGDKFADLATTDRDGAPDLEGSITRLLCRPFAVHLAGDHRILVAEVLSFERHAGAPLIFHGGAFGRLAGPNSE